MLLALVQSSTEPAASLGMLASAAIGVAASFALGGAKKGIGVVNAKVFGIDAKIVNFTKPFQPFLVGGLSIALPLLGNAIGITDIPEAAIFASAPTATVIGIVAREVVRRALPTPRLVP